MPPEEDVYLCLMARVSAPKLRSPRARGLGQNSCQPVRVAARIGASIVARLGNRTTIARIERLAITNSGSNAHVFH